MKHSPLQLLRYLVPEITCSASPTFNPEKGYEGGTENFTVEATVSKIEDSQKPKEHSWSIQMQVSQKVNEGQNFPYTFELTLIGFFSCKDGFESPEKEERFVRVNGSTMLYGAVRELVRSITALGPWGEIIVPTLSFYETKPKEEKPADPKTE